MTERERERERGRERERERERGAILISVFVVLHQVSRSDHENLAKRYDQLCAQVRVLQHDKERLERVQQEKQDLENKYYDEMKRYVYVYACVYIRALATIANCCICLYDSHSCYISSL